MGNERDRIRQADFRGADLMKVKFRGEDFRKADFREANLKLADLCGANCQWANFWGANCQWVNFQQADLREANLQWTNLWGADLRGARINNVIGNGLEIKSMRVAKWIITWTSVDLAIGCEQHAIKDWWDFDNEKIDSMAPDALTWWRKWKPILRQVIEESSTLAEDMRDDKTKGYQNPGMRCSFK